MSLRILLVEDDRELRATLREALVVEGYEVLTAASLFEAKVMLQQALESGSLKRVGFDLILLDLGLPDGEGDSLLSVLHRRQAIPVIVISAREAEGQKIRLLDGGADDYLVKPFSLGELLARIRVALRHRGMNVRAAITHYENLGVVVDLKNYRVERDGQLVHLTPTEFKLLARLVRSAGQVVTHRQLLVDVWGMDYIEHTHYLRLYMGQLRAKLEIDPAIPRLLFTEAGVGYRCLDISD